MFLKGFCQDHCLGNSVPEALALALFMYLEEILPAVFERRILGVL